MVEYIPKGEDHEKFLSCRGVNPHLPNLAVEDQWKITVHGRHYHLLHLIAFKNLSSSLIHFFFNLYTGKILYVQENTFRIGDIIT